MAIVSFEIKDENGFPVAEINRHEKLSNVFNEHRDQAMNLCVVKKQDNDGVMLCAKSKDGMVVVAKMKNDPHWIGKTIIDIPDCWNKKQEKSAIKLMFRSYDK